MNYDEGPLTFDPTYKYKYQSETYDTSKKERVPSWTDRILFSQNTDTTPIFYSRAEIDLSDHKPVLGLFSFKVRRINKELMKEVEEQVIRKCRAEL